MVLFGIAEIESAVFIIPIGMIIGGVVMILTNDPEQKTAPKSQAPSTATQTTPKISGEKLLEFEYQLKISYIQSLLEDMNFDFALGLYDGDIYQLARSDDPYKMMRQYIKEGFPTLQEFKSNIMNNAHAILHTCGLDSEKAQQIEDRICEELEDLTTQEEIDMIAAEFSKDVPEELSFLYGKINYTVAVLGHMEAIAQETNDLELHNKVTDIRRKNGYID